MSYKLQATLFVDADTGWCIALAGLNLLTEKGIYQYRPEEIQPKKAIWTHFLKVLRSKNNYA